MGIDLNSQKDKVRKSAEDAKKKALEAKQKAMDARKKVQAYASQGMKQRVICLVAFGAILLTLCYAFYSTALRDEFDSIRFGCQPTATQDCKKYLDVLNLWRPYRVTPYNIPED